MLLLTLRGTPVLYYGEEIGMHNVDIPAGQEHDPQGERIGRSRDPARTPMQWNSSAHAGFTADADPWLPVAEDFEAANVNVESGSPSLLALRREEPG